MSQTKIPKLKIRNKEPGRISKGANTIVTLDDVALLTVSFLKIEIKAAKLAKVTMEMYVDLDIELDTEPDIKEVKLRDGANYATGQYHPIFYKGTPDDKDGRDS
jgi:hypothetical protein